MAGQPRASPVRRFLAWLANAIRFAGPVTAMSSQANPDQRSERLTDSAMLINAGRDLGAQDAAPGRDTDRRS